jgi:hypothetical protein
MNPGALLAATAIIGLTASSCLVACKVTEKGEDDYEATLENHYRGEEMRKHRQESMDKLHERSIRQ